MTPEAPTCDLCDLPTPDPPITDDAVEGVFCCPGCLGVQRALGDKSQQLDSPAESTPEPDPELPGETTFLAIEGMHCTTCEAFLSVRGRRIDGIHAVEASYASETARVQYDPDELTSEEVAEALSGSGYQARHRRPTPLRSDRTSGLAKFLVGGGLFGMMVMVWYAVFLYPTYFGLDPIVSPGGFDALYVYANIWLFSSFVVFYTGWPILRGAVVSLRARAPNMDLLVTVAVLAAYVYSTLAMGLGRSDLYFDVSVAIVLVVTAGTYYEGRMKRRALGDIMIGEDEQLVARRSTGESVDPDALQPGDEVLVRAGERIPLDGFVREGEAAVDTAVLTGEPLPVTVTPGDEVPGGGIVTDEPLVIEVGPDAESTRDRLLERLWTIQTGQAGFQKLADKLATIFVPLVLLLGLLVTLGALWLGSGLGTALLAGLTVLIVACPCALGLATPLAIAAGVRAGIRRGIIVATAAVFEAAPSIDIIAIDKTGTLTAGEMTVTDVYADDPETVLSMAAAVEQFTTHPIAAAILNETGQLTPPIRTDGGAAASIQDHRRGVSGTVDGTTVVVGHPTLLEEHGISIDKQTAATVHRVRDSGSVPVVVGWNGTTEGVIAVGDRPRSAWTETIASLAADREVVIITGDEGPSVEQFRELDAVESVFEGVPPEGKAATVRRLQEQGSVAMVGDGSNDGPALAAADLGIALAEGTAVATDAADVVLRADDLDAVDTLFDVVSGTNRRIRQNLGWAFVYNGIAIPLAVAGLINPLLAALAMATSSILVVANTARPIAGK